MEKIDGTMLRQVRMKKKMSIRHLAELAGVNKSTITRIENNETSPTIDVIERILSALSMRLRVEEHEECKSTN